VDVTVTTLPQTPFYKQLMANGKAESTEKTDLRFKTANRIASIKARNGTKVNKGQVIAHLENALLKNNLEKSRLALEKANVKFQEALINYNYGNTDVKQVAPEIIRNLKLKSGVLDAEIAYNEAKIRYNNTLLKAPFTGVVANIKSHKGDYIGSSDVFCTVINPRKLQVQFDILENDFAFVAHGQEVYVQTFDKKADKIRAVITEINPAVDKNGLIKIKAVIRQNHPGLIDGMHVKVWVNRPVKDVLVVPKEAVVLRSNKKVVFTLKNGLAQWNYITALYENSKYIAVKKGENLKPADTVIVSGNSNLSHEAKVNATFIHQKD